MKLIERFKNGSFVITCEIGPPKGIEVEKKMKEHEELKIKEIVVISLENNHSNINSGEDLEISHKYLLIYRVDKGGK